MRSSLIPIVRCLAACGGPKPEVICTRNDVHHALGNLIFENATREADANSADLPQIDWAAVKKKIFELRYRTIFKPEFTTFKGFDKNTRSVNCEISVRVTLPPDLRSPSFVATASNFNMDAGLPNLFGDSPQAIVDFTVQPDASGKSDIVASNSLQESSGAVLLLAMTEWATEKMASRGR